MVPPEARNVVFHATGTAAAAWSAEVDGQTWWVSGAGPDGPFTLRIGDADVVRLATWPAAWSRSVVPRRWVREHFERVGAANAASLVRAEADAAASGKEPFSIARLREYGGPLPTRDESALRADYYVMHPELRTLAAYAAHCARIEPWRDSS